MKKIILALAALCCTMPLFAQASVNYFPESIIGVYQSKQNGDEFKVRISKADPETYTGQIIWIKDSVDPKTGEKFLDAKNPDKSLRNVPCDQIVIITGLMYNSEKKCWDKGKIYDPQRGIRANCKAYFEPDGRLCIKGSLAGVGEKVFWHKIEE